MMFITRNTDNFIFIETLGKLFLISNQIYTKRMSPAKIQIINLIIGANVDKNRHVNILTYIYYIYIWATYPHSRIDSNCLALNFLGLNTLSLCKLYEKKISYIDHYTIPMEAIMTPKFQCSESKTVCHLCLRG